MRVCVIGAGIVGASIAYHLTRHPGVRVTIVDAGHPGAATTAAGTGWISARAGEDEPYRQLRLAAMEEHHSLLADFSAAWMVTGGVLNVEGDSAAFDAMIEASHTVDYPVEVHSAAHVMRELEPHVRIADPSRRVAHFTSEFTVSGSVVAAALFDAAVANGAFGHIGSRVIRLERADALHRVMLEDGTVVEADAVVNAAGARAAELAAHYDIPMPLLPQPGMAIHVRAPGNPLRRMITVGSLVAKPETDGVVRLRSLVGWTTKDGAGERTGFTGGQELTEFVDDVLAAGGELLPSIAPIRSIATRIGVRPFPADGRPRVGAVESVPGYYEAVMHSGGVLGPFVGRHLAAEIVTGDIHDMLRDYRPARFLTA